MAHHLFTFILAIASRKGDTEWLLREFYSRIAQLRSATVAMNQQIPAYFEEATLSELDEFLTAAWLMTGYVSIDHQCLTELDVLGAALEFPGGQTRLALHVRDAIRNMGLANPWENFGSSNSL